MKSRKTLHMFRRYRFALPLLLIVTAAGVFPASASEWSIEGLYISKGTSPTGAEHHGVVHIQRQGDGMLVAWLVPQREDGMIVLVPVAAGIGIVEGGMLAVSYFTPNAGGIILFRIEDNGARLTGRRIAAGSDGTAHSETLTRVPTDVQDPPGPDPSEHGVPSTPSKSVPPPGGHVM